MPGGIQALARSTAVQSGALDTGKELLSLDDCFCKPSSKKLGRSKITSPCPIKEKYNDTGYQEPRAHPGILVLGSEGQQKILIRHEKKKTAIVKFSGLRSKSEDSFNSRFQQPQSALAQDGKGPSLEVCVASEFRQEIRAPHPVGARIQFTLNV